MKRQEVRELAFKALFANDIESTDPIRHLDYILGDGEMAQGKEGGSEPSLSASDREYAVRLITGVCTNKAELDALITNYSLDWQTERLGGAERSILRIGFYEMLYDEKLPPAIAINVALELAKKYCAQEAAGFVNGILGKKAEEMKELVKQPGGSPDARDKETQGL